MQEKVKQMTRRFSSSSIGSSPSTTSSALSCDFSPRNRVLLLSPSLSTRSSGSIQPPGTPKSTRGRRSDPLPETRQTRHQAYAIGRETGTRQNNEGTNFPGRGSRINDLEKLRQWPFEEHSPQASANPRSPLEGGQQTAQAIPLSRWPLSSPRVEDHVLNIDAICKQWSQGNRYVADPITIRKSPDENSTNQIRKSPVFTSAKTHHLDSPEDRELSARTDLHLIKTLNTRLFKSTEHPPNDVCYSTVNKYCPQNINNPQNNQCPLKEICYTTLDHRRDFLTDVNQPKQFPLEEMDFSNPIQGNFNGAELDSGKQSPGQQGKRFGYQMHAAFVSKLHQLKRRKQQEIVPNNTTV